MKSILLSVRPEWVAKILNGEKTIEIRKTAPKCDLPIEVYIYCTKEDDLLLLSQVERDMFVRGKDFDIKDYYRLHSAYNGNGKVVAKFTLRKISEIVNEMRTDLDDSKYPSYFAADMSEHKLLGNAYLTAWEIHNYLKLGKGYAWHIEDLVIFDQPKELSDFGCYYDAEYCNGEGLMVKGREFVSLKRAPQSWCYVEVLE